jgi:hypothetical protein
MFRYLWRRTSSMSSDQRPVHKAFAAPRQGLDQLDADMHEPIAEFNEGGDGDGGAG